MGLGILEDTYLAHVPGTCIFSDDPSLLNQRAVEDAYGASGARIDFANLKHAIVKGKGKGGRKEETHIVLVPRPSIPISVAGAGLKARLRGARKTPSYCDIAPEAIKKKRHDLA